MILGGKGLIDSCAAASIATNWQAAAKAAAGTDPQALTTALEQVEQFLNRVSSLDLEAELRARWISGGGTADTFPGTEDWELGDRSPWEIARLVDAMLARPEEVLFTRWQEIARAVAVSDLGHELAQLGPRRVGGKVNDLLRAGIDEWSATSAYVPRLEADTLDRFDAVVGKYSVGLNLINRCAYFSNVVNKWNRVPRSTNLPTVASRSAMLSDPDVQGVAYTTADENVVHELRPNATGALSDRLKQIGIQGGPNSLQSAEITSIDVRVGAAGTVARIDFRRDVVRANGPIPVRDLVMLCATYLANLEPEEIDELKDAYSLNSEGSQ